MNFYKRHLGDYAKDAGHLSMLEHGAYTLLLDRYYTTEQPIAQEDAYRVARARSQAERQAVDTVLREFFITDSAAWLNRRAEEEIKKASHQREVNREIGKRGGRPKQTESETESVPVRNPTPDSKTPDTKETSEAIASAAASAEADRGEAIFALGLPLLTAASVPEKQGRSFLGFLRKHNTDKAITAALDRCAKHHAAAPIEFLQGCLKTGAKHHNRQEALEESNRAVGERWLAEAEKADATH